MSDTIQTVRWRLDSGEQQHIWLPPGRERPNAVIWESIRRTGVESQLRRAFLITDPLWYGFWIESPLTQQQCSLLYQVLSDVTANVPRYRDHLSEFINALKRAAETGCELNVDLAPPGHVDLGWITTFVHCPRCKAEGPFDRWQESYSPEPIDCPVCGNTYSPAKTYNSEREYFAESVTCSDCRTSFRVKKFSDAEIAMLENHYYYHEAVDELSWLHRVAAFYERHPDRKGQIKPHFLNVMDSDDPKVQDDLIAGVPFDEIALPDDSHATDPPDWSNEDREVADYLRHHHFSLRHRMKAIEESIQRLEPEVKSKSVTCPQCGGRIETHNEHAI